MDNLPESIWTDCYPWYIDYPSVAQFSLSALKTLYRVMSQGDQQNMYNTATRALATAKRRGENKCVDYWSGQPVVSMEILP